MDSFSSSETDDDLAYLKPLSSSRLSNLPVIDINSPKKHVIIQNNYMPNEVNTIEGSQNSANGNGFTGMNHNNDSKQVTRRAKKKHRSKAKAKSSQNAECQTTITGDVISLNFYHDSKAFDKILVSSYIGRTVNINQGVSQHSLSLKDLEHFLPFIQGKFGAPVRKVVNAHTQTEETLTFTESNVPNKDKEESLPICQKCKSRLAYIPTKNQHTFENFGSFEQSCQKEGSQAFEQSCPTEGLQAFEQSYQTEVLQTFEQSCPTEGLQAFEQSCQTEGLQAFEQSCQTEGLQTFEQSCPTEGLQAFEQTCPTEGLQAFEQTCPTEGLQAFELSFPTEGLQALELSCPTERLQALELSCPTEGLQAFEQTCPTEGLQAFEQTCPTEGLQAFEQTCLTEGLQAFEQTCPTEGLQVFEQSCQIEGLQAFEQSCPTEGLQAFEPSCQTEGLQDFEPSCPTEGLKVFEQICPTEGLQDLPSFPTEGLQVFEQSCPTEGLQAFEQSCPTEGLQVFEQRCQTERLQAFEQSCPTEGLQAFEKSCQTENLQALDHSCESNPTLKDGNNISPPENTSTDLPQIDYKSQHIPDDIQKCIFVETPLNTLESIRDLKTSDIASIHRQHDTSKECSLVPGSSSHLTDVENDLKANCPEEYIQQTNEFDSLSTKQYTRETRDNSDSEQTTPQPLLMDSSGADVPVEISKEESVCEQQVYWCSSSNPQERFILLCIFAYIIYVSAVKSVTYVLYLILNFCFIFESE